MRALKKVWGVPFILGAITLFGLLAALLGTGYWYGMAWASMSLPVLVIIWKIIQQNRIKE